MPEHDIEGGHQNSFPSFLMEQRFLPSTLLFRPKVTWAGRLPSQSSRFGNHSRWKQIRARTPVTGRWLAGISVSYPQAGGLKNVKSRGGGVRNTIYIVINLDGKRGPRTTEVRVRSLDSSLPSPDPRIKTIMRQQEATRNRTKVL